MIIGERLRELREHKKLSQGDIEKRTGLLRCYISRVENGHTVPAIETLEKLARAMEIPLYQLFYDSEEPPKVPNLPKRTTADDLGKLRQGREDAGTVPQASRQDKREESANLIVHGAADGTAASGASGAGVAVASGRAESPKATQLIVRAVGAISSSSKARASRP